MILSKFMNFVIRFVNDENYRFSFFRSYGFYDSLPDDEYLRRQYKAKIGKILNLDNPLSFNEKIQWLKLYDRKPEYTMMVDKYKVREYIAEQIGEEYLIPLLGVWNNPKEIDFEKLPNQFVLKCNHNSGLGMCICKDKSSLDFRSTKRKLIKGFKQDFFLTGREWPYKDVSRKIIAEKYMVEENTSEQEVISNEGLNDYKIMCFNGIVKCSFVCSDRFSKEGLKVTFYDRDWNVMPFERHYPKSDKTLSRPYNYEKMIELAEKLSKGIPFVRVDFYEINKKIYFGELTFYPGSGFEEFTPESADYVLGEWIKIKCIKK